MKLSSCKPLRELLENTKLVFEQVAVASSIFGCNAKFFPSHLYQISEAEVNKKNRKKK